METKKEKKKKNYEYFNTNICKTECVSVAYTNNRNSVKIRNLGKANKNKKNVLA